MHLGFACMVPIALWEQLPLWTGADPHRSQTSNTDHKAILQSGIVSEPLLMIWKTPGQLEPRT